MGSTTSSTLSRLWGSQQQTQQQQQRRQPGNEPGPTRTTRVSSLVRQLSQRPRFQTLSDFPTAQTAGGLGGNKITKLHNPMTYLGLSALALVRWNGLGRNPLYWFAVGFCIKWYRARYVFKIPVWDRQPNWNNIITSKEQEKDLKAFTCKNCGSTIFIAKTREFFFEGDTGIGGLGCFSCGAKGADNFIMDRDRIIEDVGDDDDYFEYEQPLDFVSRAERRKVLQEAQGDEDKANQILLDRAASTTTTTDTVVVDAETVVPDPDQEDEPPAAAAPTEAKAAPEPTTSSSSSTPIKKKKEEPPAAVDASDDDDGLDALDMDL